MENLISSMQNPKIRKLLLLQQKSSERRKDGLFVVEGQRELLHCLEAGYEIDSVFCCPALFNDGEYADALQHYISGSRYFEVSEPVYQKIAYRGTTEGIVAGMKSRTLCLDNLRP